MIFKVDSHTHTISSGHAYSTITENASIASKMGLEAIGMSDHAPDMPGGPSEIFFYNLHVIGEELFGVRIFKSIELNIKGFDGSVDSCINDRIYKEMDYTIASFHPIVFPPGSKVENTRAYINVMDNPNINIIGHPDDGRVPVDFDELAKNAKETNTILEINNSSLLSKSFRENAEDNYREMLRYCEKYGTLITTGSDAHFSTLVGNFDKCIEILEEVSFPKELIISTSKERFINSIKLKK